MGQVRIATAKDGAALVAIYAPYVTDSVISFEQDPPDAAEMARRIEKVLPHHPWLVFERDGAVLGYAYGCAHRERAAYAWSVDLAVYVARQAHRRGVGRALYTALLPILRRQGFYAAFAGITLPNSASVTLHEGFGFSSIGVYRNVGFKLGAWRDVGWWGLELQPPAPDPAPPRPFRKADFEPG